VSCRRATPLVVLALAVAWEWCGGTPKRAAAPVTRTHVAQSRLQLKTALPPAVLDGCRKVARSYRGRVFCPPLVPSGRTSAEFVGSWTGGSARSRRASYVLDFNSPSLQRIFGRPVDANGGHWVVEAGTDPALSNHWGGYIPRGEWRGRIALRRTTLAGVPVRIYTLAEKNLELYFAGHVAVVWRHAGVVNAVSMHGHANRPRTLAMARALIRLQRACDGRPAGAAPCSLVLTGRG
jgi:hypothetical protein